MNGPQWSEARARASAGLLGVTVMLAIAGALFIVDSATGWVGHLLSLLP